MNDALADIHDRIAVVRAYSELRHHVAAKRPDFAGLSVYSMNGS